MLIIITIISSNDFQHTRRANNAMPTNTAMPMFLTSCETEISIWKYDMAESELLCVRVATLLRNKYASIQRVDVIGQYMLAELLRFLFYCSRYLPSHNYCPGKKK